MRHLKTGSARAAMLTFAVVTLFAFSSGMALAAAPSVVTANHTHQCGPNPSSQYPPGTPCQGHTNTPFVVAGGELEVSAPAGDFNGSEFVRVVIDGRTLNLFILSKRANADGSFEVTFRLPSSVQPGAHEVDLTGQTSGQLVVVPFTVTAAPHNGLPFTGANIIGMIAAAGGLLLAGIVTLVFVRRRHALRPIAQS